MARIDNDLKKAEKKIQEAIEKSMRGACIELFSEIVRKTPVGNPLLWKNPAAKGYIGGTLRGNWQASLRSPETSTVDTTDETGSHTISQGASKVNSFKISDKDIWFSNNLPYAQKIEDGHSKQRPQGMVKTTIKQFSKLIDKFARINKI